jgi:hypothetical protein
MLHLKNILKVFLCILLPGAYSNSVSAQCNNPSAFGTTALPTVAGNSTTATGIFAGEYRTLTGAVNGTTYTFSSSVGTDFITVRRQTPGGVVVASGFTPLTFVNNFTGTIYAHINTNSACGTQSTGRTITFFHGVPFNPCSSVPTVTCGTATSTTLAGSNTWSTATCGFTMAGREAVYSFTPTTTGAHTITANSVSGGYTDFFYKAASGGCNSGGWTCLADINAGPVTFTLGNLTAGTQYYILLDKETTATGTINWTINCPTPIVDPCTAILPITCGTATSTTLNGGGMYNPPSTSCGFSTPGQEKIYSFTPTATSPYTLTVNTSTSTAYIDYFFKNASSGCNSTGWTCIDDILGTTGAISLGTLTAGVQYYFLLDGESTSTSATQSWTINGAPAATPGISGTTTICNGGSTTLTASGTLNANAAWTWYSGSCGGTVVGTGPSITVSPTVSTTYFVRGTGGCATNGSCASVTVTVNQPVAITGQPVGANLCAGSALNLSVTASNATGYQWYLGGSPISGATSATYNVPSTTTANAGSYYCIVSGAAPCASVQSNTVTVNVTAPATVVTQPAATVGVCQGGTLTLAVTANNATSYQWYLNSSPISGATSATYSVGPVTSANAGTYYLVMGSNSPCGNVQTMNYVVSITPNPTITTQPPTSVSVCAGSALNIPVVAANAASYQWYLGGNPISGATSATYNVPSSSLANQGIYHVVAIGFNGCGTVTSSNSFATVTLPAAITTQPVATTNLCAGSTLNLSVTANNAAGYQWYRNSVLIPGATSATYNVGSVTTADAGTYHVVVTANSPCANVTSSNAVVNVTTPASITTPAPAAITVCNGSALSMSVTAANATGYQWYRNSILIPGANFPTYSVASATAANAGTYYVVLSSNSPCGPITSSNTVVTVNPRPTATLSTNAPTTICNGQFASMSVAFTGSGPWTFTRFNGSTSVTETVNNNPYTFFFTPSANTTYSITALNDINCTAIPADYSGTASVIVRPRPTAVITASVPTTICNGATATMNIALTGTSPWTFNYSNGITNTQVTTTSNPYTFTITPSTTSTYSLNVLVDANCIATPADYAGSATITVNPRPTAALDITGPATICDGGSTTMSVAFTGTAPWTFTYFNGTSSTTVTTSANPYVATLSPSTTSTYSITALNDLNCTAIAADFAGSKTVNVNPRPTAAISVNGAATVCDGTPTSIDVALTGNGPWTLSYTDGSNITSVTTATSPYTFAVSPSTATTYSVTSLFDVNCTAISADYAGNATVNVNPRPTAAVVVNGASTICDGTPTNIDINLTGNGPWVFDYFDGTSTTTVTTPNNTYSFSVSPSSTTTYSVTSLSDMNCSAVSADLATTATITVHPRPMAITTINGPAAICNGTTSAINIALTGTPPWTFAYFDGTTPTNVTTSANPYSFNVTPNTSTTYSILSLVDANCMAQLSDYATTAALTVNYEPVITSQPSAVTECSGIGTSLSVGATGTALTYQWMKDGVNVMDDANYNGSNSPVLNINNISGTSGSYQVVINGTCPPTVASAPVTVTENVNNMWYGAVDEKWSEPGNWSCGTIPIVTTNVLIPTNALVDPVVDIPTAICNSLTIQPMISVSFSGTTNALEVKSSIDNYGIFDPSAGKIILSGTSIQNLPAVTYKDLQVEGGSIKKTDGPVTIANMLELTHGFIDIGIDDITIESPAMTTGGDANAFIITSNTGTVIAKNLGVGGNAAPYMYHVGTDPWSYNPVMLENMGTPDDYGVRVMSHVYEDGYGINPLMVDNPVVDRTWMVEEGTAGGSYVNLNPYWNAADEINGFDQTHVYVAHYLNGEWIGYTDSALGAPAAGTFGTMFFADADSIENFSPFTVASAGQFPLSIKLENITAANVGARNRVNWSSAGEDPGDIYHLERSVDGRKFSLIADINAKGEASNYSYWDENPVIGRNYYRLRMEDLGGHIHYSKVVSAVVSGSEADFSITAFPNPVSNKVSVAINGEISGKAEVIVTDVAGRVVRKAEEVKGSTIDIDMSSMPEGIYFIKYSDNTHNEAIKLKKQ